MIFLEQEFWNGYVQKRVPPPYLEDGAVIMESIKRHCGPADEKAPAIVWEGELASALVRYMRMQEEKENSEKYTKKLDKELQRLKAILIAGMGTNCTAVCNRGGKRYTATYNPVRKATVDKDNLVRLKLQYPEIYEKFVTVSEFRKFHVKVKAETAA